MTPSAARPTPSGDKTFRMIDPLHAFLNEAMADRASDIHIDPLDRGHVVRHRVDGAVHVKRTVSDDQAQRVINQLKLACELEIEHAWVPLEGQFAWEHAGEPKDFRVTIMPTQAREAAHVRVLTPPRRQRDLQELGFTPHAADCARQAVQRPHGLILISGLTGTGKTTTLSALTSLYDLTTRITASIEDPIELHMPYVRQLQTDEEHGFTMLDGLHVLLRSDPDVLLVGEVRDAASARTIVQAALAGRLVMATVHARDTAAAIESMRMLDVPSAVLGHCLHLVIAQDLVRTLCEHCAETRDTQKQEARLFKLHGVPTPRQLGKPAGCEQCNGYGYVGRTGVFELVTADASMQSWLAKGPEQREIRKRFAQEGTQTLAADALSKVAEGRTTLEEVLRLIDA